MDPNEKVIDYIKNTAEFVRTKDGLVSASNMLERFLFPSSQQYSPIGKLSGGEKRRLNLLRVLMEAPNVLILDEPTAGQDYRHYTEIMEFLKEINETQGTTIIMITHDMHLMLEYTNRAIVVADGKLLTIDTPAKVLTNETITAPAYLKQTSLYEMAVKCGIEDPSQFVQRFINYERAVR
jgi:energy-coupling factor transporter ATP-binding protein EcfA2